MNLQQSLTIFFLMVFAIYLGSMWTHITIKRQAKIEEQERLWLAQQNANGNGNGA